MIKKDICGLDEGKKHYGLIDSGSAATAAPMKFGAGMPLIKDQAMNLVAVNGEGIAHHGRREVACKVKADDGEKIDTLIKAQIADVSKLVLSVGSMSDHGIGTWMPPEGASNLWMVDENYNWVDLTEPCLIKDQKAVPITKDQGVYWLPVEELDQSFMHFD